MKKIIGIDPGQTGAIAGLRRVGKSYVSQTWEECSSHTLITAVKEFKPQLVVIEKQQAMSKQGVVSTFTTGRNFGLLEGVLQALKVEYVVVSPRDWMSVIHKTYGDIPTNPELASSSLKSSKVYNLSLCSTLFNESLVTPRGRWKDGVADALLIALYGFLRR